MSIAYSGGLWAYGRTYLAGCVRRCGRVSKRLLKVNEGFLGAKSIKVDVC